MNRSSRSVKAACLYGLVQLAALVLTAPNGATAKEETRPENAHTPPSAQTRSTSGAASTFTPATGTAKPDKPAGGAGNGK